MPDYFKRAAKEIKRRKLKGTESLEIEEWQSKWLEAGPIRFAEEVLTCPLDVPEHPDWNEWKKKKTEKVRCDACSDSWGQPFKHKRFRENGIPFHIILSKDQKVFLEDIWLNDIDLALVAAARGAGKTFIFAIWDCWQIAVKDNYKITCMGGSSKQSKIIQGYLDDWRIDLPILNKIIYKSLRGIDRYCLTRGRSRADFPACSTTAARGPHVSEVQIDECCEAEDKSEDGAKAVAAVMWQTTGKREGKILLSSTAHYIHGKFYDYMSNPEKYGFKVYRWAIAKHVSGKDDPYKVYTDKNPKNWKPKVWWLTQEEIEKKRRSKSDEEWLCEALGGASMASGAVLKKSDLDVVICSLCENCEPYKWDTCPLVKLASLGIESDPIKYIIERRAGFDYGVSDAPCALTVLGRKQNVVFVLFNDEQLGLREDEKIGWIHENCQNFRTWTFIPDPAIGGKHLNEKLGDMGYAVYIIPESEKTERVFNVINHVEKHKMIIPKCYWYLTQSLRKLAWKNNKIRKIDDHSFDTIQYGMVDYNLEEGGSGILDAFLERQGSTSGKVTPSIQDMWGMKDVWKE